MTSADPLEPIAIVGIGCRFPGAPDPTRFWQMLCGGVDAIGPVPVDRWDADKFYDPDPAAPGKINSRNGGFLDGVDQFDPSFFGIAPREADLMDPQQRLLLEVTWEALEDAGIPPALLAGTPTGVFMGLASANYGSLLFSSPQHINAFSNIGSSVCIAANRISYTWDLAGPSMVVDTACSSSLVAVHLACQSLWTGESTVALAGGVNVILLPGPSISAAKARTLSPDGRCRVFDAGASGFGRGEGAGVVVLKPLSRARADGDCVYAVIRASATMQNGRTNGLMAPSRWAQQAVLRSAYHRAGISPGLVQYVEAHSSGTPIGDAAEINALAEVLKEDRPEGQKCAIGSVKTNLGHLEAASGIAGLIKVALMLRHGKLVPSLHYQSPNAHVPFASLPLRVQQDCKPWAHGERPAVAGVSASGYGGVNVHVVLEEVPTLAQLAPPPKVSHLLTLSARNASALRELAERCAVFLDQQATDESLADICFTFNSRRTHFPERLAVLGDSTSELRNRLLAFLEGNPPTKDLYRGVAKRAVPKTPAADVASTAASDIAARYVAGGTENWVAVYGAGRTHCVGLPTYPFQRQRHWIPASAEPEAAVAAGSDVKRTLLDLWRRILGVKDLKITDNFFELGGGSLMAAEMLVEIDRLLGVTCAPGMLFEYPTIEQLAGAIKSGGTESQAPLLVTIRDTGTRPPIFLVAPDHLLHYAELIGCVDPDYPLYGLQPPYLDGFRKAGMTIEQMADAYLAELARVCPQGACHLVGMCAGGVIAYEMALRLATDRPIGALALIDAPCPVSLGNVRPPGRLRYAASRFATHANAIRRHSPRDAVAYLLVRARLAASTALRPITRHTTAPEEAAALASIANRAAIFRYRPARYDGPVALFNAVEPFPSAEEDTRLDWRQVATNIHVYNFEGGHADMLRAPQVSTVAAKLTEQLIGSTDDLVSSNGGTGNQIIAR